MKIETAAIAHVQGIAQVHVASWQSAYKGILPAKLLKALSVSDRAAMWMQIIEQKSADVWVATRDDKVFGFVSVAPSRDADALPNTAEIQAIYMAPTEWSTGAGRRLIQAAMQGISARHFAYVTLWVLADNVRAIRFYENAGFVCDLAANKSIELGGVSVIEQRFTKVV